MIVALIVGLFVGFVLAIPPGPIGMASVRTGLRDGLRSSMWLAIGAGLLDVIYCAIAMWASSGVVSLLESFERGNPNVSTAIQIVIASAMIGFGIIQMREHPVKRASEGGPARGASVIARVVSRGPFFVGVGFALANTANPTFLPAVVTMTTFVQKVGIFEQSLSSAMAFSLGFGAGNTLWLLTLVRLVLAYRQRMTETFIHRMQQAAGVTLVGFGAYYGVRCLYIGVIS